MPDKSGERPLAVLLDMDGTLVDTEGLWWAATSSVAHSLGTSLSPDDTPHVLGRTVEDTAAFLLTLVPHTSPYPFGSPDSSGSHGSPGSHNFPGFHGFPGSLDETVRRLTASFASLVGQGVRVFPGVHALLGELSRANVRTALVSASPREIVDLVLPVLGHPFDLVLAAEDTARGKPYPDPYLEAAKRLSVPPERCVAVEDSPTGIAAATAAGCQVIAVSPEKDDESLHFQALLERISSQVGL
ncbi:HAD family phosphatase [Nonomuraea sp. NPDC046570]|uniref:HAD family hydrolase n=1 Tax=Nonomuraea sp. NPDC046570 TaxID=3155255 RepID=UPI0033D1AE17